MYPLRSCVTVLTLLPALGPTALTARGALTPLQLQPAVVLQAGGATLGKLAEIILECLGCV
jgi:hypothetical protein